MKAVRIGEAVVDVLRASNGNYVGQTNLGEFVLFTMNFWRDTMIECAKIRAEKDQ